jgi:hypothetical protein
VNEQRAPRGPLDAGAGADADASVNPQIRAFNAAGTFEGMQDSELAKLSQYVGALPRHDLCPAFIVSKAFADRAVQLLHLAANVEDFTEADHTVRRGVASRCDAMRCAALPIRVVLG